MLNKVKPKIIKPRLNQASLMQMAKRHKTSILASAYRNQILPHFISYLTHVINKLSEAIHPPHEMIDVEKNLEAIEAALVHLWITFPYNEVLSVPRRLASEQIDRISLVLEEGKRMRRHLHIAYPKAA